MNKQYMHAFLYALAALLIVVGVVLWAMHPVGMALVVYYTLLTVGVYFIVRIICVVAGAVVLYFIIMCMGGYHVR